jgi:hypothetical protein
VVFRILVLKDTETYKVTYTGTVVHVVPWSSQTALCGMVPNYPWNWHDENSVEPWVRQKLEDLKICKRCTTVLREREGQQAVA